MERVLFYLFSSVAVASALAVALSRRPAYAALALILCFCCLSGLFGLLGAPLVAAVQIIVYAGAILVLFVLVIMLLQVKGESPYAERPDLVSWAALVAGVLVAAELIVALGEIRTAAAPAGISGSPGALGRYLFTSYLVPFEATSVLFLAALIGATWVAKR